ncbi:MAG: SDR family NAD(P)-dependent oxidoreductase [Vicinamibacteria bacterium]
MIGRLAGKAALVTGSSKGIGFGIAAAYLEEGARVFLCARGEKDLERAAAKLERIGSDVDYAVADVGDVDQAKRLVEAALSRFQDLSILVNNASILGKRAPIVETDAATWDEVLRINTSSIFYVTRPLLPALIERGSGSIINVSSSVGRKGKPNWGPYAVSKFGLEGFTQVLAEELRPHGIRVNSVNPGATRTGMRADAYPDEDPLTLPTPADIAEVFVYLASDESASVTGQAFEARDYLKRARA